MFLPPLPDAPVGFTPNSQGPTASAIISQILAMTYAQINQAILTGGGCVWASRLLTAAEVCTANTIPLTMVSAAALPANTVIQPVYSVLQQRVGAAIYSAAPSFRGRWAGLTDDIAMVDGMTNTAGTYVYFLNELIAGGTTSPARPENRDVELSSTADRTLGSGTVRETFGYQLGPTL